MQRGAVGRPYEFNFTTLHLQLVRIELKLLFGQTRKISVFSSFFFLVNKEW